MTLLTNPQPISNSMVVPRKLDRKIVERRWRDMFAETNSWKPIWQDLSSYIFPERGYFDTKQPNQGERNDSFILDGTPIQAATILAAGMQSGLTSPARPWFRLTVPDPDLSEFGPVRYWLNDVQDRMMTVFARSTIYNVLHSVYEEIGPFGTAAMIVLEDYDKVIRGRSFTIGEYALGTGPDLRVNSFARYAWMTVLQLVQEFGLENVSHHVRTAYENNNTERWVKVYHLIEPNDSRIPGFQDARNKPYRSIYWEEGAPEDKYLRVSGFDEFPIMAPRWNVVGAKVYGVGPGWRALGDSKSLQKMNEDFLVAVEKSVNPPINAPTSVLNSGGVNILPGGVTFYAGDNPDAIRPMFQINPDLQGIQLAMQQKQQSIRAAFFADLFLMIYIADKNQMTAREVAERHEEKLLMLGPVLERLQSELLDPLIDRTFGIMYRNGLIPPPPEELQGEDLKVEYVSILAQAQKMVGTTAIEQLSGFVGSLAAVNPAVLDKMDFDEAVDHYAAMLGIPEGIVRADDKVAEIRALKAQQAAQLQAAQMGMQMAQGAKILSETDTGKNNALTALLGGMVPSP